MTQKNFFLFFFLILTILSAATLKADNAVQNDTESAMMSTSAVHTSLKYWTPERMANAKPYPDVFPRFAKKSAVPTRPGTPGSGDSGLPGESIYDVITRTLPFAVAPNSTQGYTYPAPFARYQNFDPYSKFPYSAVVKVFFSDGGNDYVCSGSVWPSRSVLTAGHCVYNNDAHRYHTNVVVVPQYLNGQGPFGTFNASSLQTTKGWQDGDFSFDFGLIQIADKGGNKISSYTGFLGARWNVTAVQHFTIIGYPAGRPFTGATQQICQSSFAYFDSGDPQPIGVGCDLTGGSSGCPWIIRFSGAAGGNNQVNGLMSYGYPSRPKDSYSPYFGDAAKNFWNYARTH